MELCTRGRTKFGLRRKAEGQTGVCCPGTLIMPVIRQGCTSYFDEVMLRMSLHVRHGVK